MGLSKAAPQAESTTEPIPIIRYVVDNVQENIKKSVGEKRNNINELGVDWQADKNLKTKKN